MSYLYGEETLVKSLGETIDEINSQLLVTPMDDPGIADKMTHFILHGTAKQMEDFARRLSNMKICDYNDEYSKKIKDIIPLRVEKFKDYKRLDELNLSTPTNQSTAYLEAIEKVLLLNKLENQPYLLF